MLSAYSTLIPPVQSYSLQPRTLELQTVAKALQQNAITAKARAVSPDTPDAYAAFMRELKKQFCESASVSGGADVREVVVMMVATLEWAEATRAIRDDVRVQILEERVSEAPELLWEMHPWLSAMLAAQSRAIRACYVRELCQHGFLEPRGREFAARVATMMLQSGEVEAAMSAALGGVDPLVLQRHFGSAPPASSSFSAFTAA